MADADNVHRIPNSPHPIAYRRSGVGHPLILLHPLALSGAVWGRYAERLAETFDVIAPDARGHGDSGWDNAPFGVDDLGDDLCSLLDGLGIASAYVVGMSMGGSAAVSFAGRYPHRVDAMLLADTTAWYGPEARQNWAKRVENVLEQPRQRQVPFQVDRWFTDTFRRRNTSEVNRVVSIFLKTDSLVHSQACRALGSMDSRALLASVTAPTLVIAGAEDYATPPAMGIAIAEGVRNGTARVLDSLRHLSLVEAPEQLGEMTANFLATGLVPA